jgi:endonuclease/exonuclease/phosphatase family metal-dependent hydrolase
MPDRVITKRIDELRAEGWDLGAAQGGVQTLGDGGVVQHFANASIYWHPRTGAHALPAPLQRRYATLGAQASSLGYPTWSAKTGAGRFEFGTLSVETVNCTLTVLAYNTALLPVIPGAVYYKGKNRDRAIATFLQKIRAYSPDIVGLSEVFLDGEKQEFQEGLKDLYPHWVAGPDVPSVGRQDGGLLLLSKHPFLTTPKELIYRMASGSDSWSNKGAWHVRIQPPGHPVPYDVFHTHAQNDDAGGVDASITVTLAQMRALGTFIQAQRDPNHPAILMGDLNVERHKYYDLLLRALRDPLEPSSFGDVITLDDGNNFESLLPDPDPLGTGASRLRKSGRQVDYIFYWNGRQTLARVSPYIPLAWMDSLGFDVSDHQGIVAHVTAVEQADLNVSRQIPNIRLQLESMVAAQLTGFDFNDDEIDAGLRFRTDAGATEEAWAGKTVDFDEGTRAAPGRIVDLIVPGDPGGNIHFEVRLTEITPVFGDVDLHAREVAFTRDSIMRIPPLGTANAIGIEDTVRVSNSGAEYFATVAATLTPWTKPIVVPGWIGGETQGAGVTVGDVDGDGKPDIVCFWVDHAEGGNVGCYRVGKRIDASGAVQEWTEVQTVSGWFGGNNQGAGIALADVDGDGKLELVVAHVDSRLDANYERGYLRIGSNFDGQRFQTWTAPVPVGPSDGRFEIFGRSEELTGVGVAVVDLTGSGRLDVLVMGGPYLNYVVGFGLRPDGTAERWSSLFGSPNVGVAPPGTGGGMAVADFNRDGRLELVIAWVEAVEDVETRIHYTTASLASDGSVSTPWSSPEPLHGWFGGSTQGADLALYDLDGDGHQEMIVFAIDNPEDENVGVLRIGRGVRGVDHKLAGQWPAGTAQRRLSPWRDHGGPIQGVPALIATERSMLHWFAVGPNRELRHGNRSGEAWLVSQDLGGILCSSPSVVHWGTERIDVVALGARNTLVHRAWHRSGGWAPWEDLGGDLASPPTIVSGVPVSPGSGQPVVARLDVVAFSRSGDLLHKFWSGSWSEWADLGKPHISIPVSAEEREHRAHTTPGNRFDIERDVETHIKPGNRFEVDVEREVEPAQRKPDHSIVQTTDLSDAQPTLELEASPHVFRGGSSRRKPGRDERSVVMERGPFIQGRGPAVVSMFDGRLDVFVKNKQGVLLHRHCWDGRWSGWSPLGGQLTSDPHAVAGVQDGWMRVFALGARGELVHRAYSGAKLVITPDFNGGSRKVLTEGSWGPWEDLGGACLHGPSAVSATEGSFDCFVVGTNSAIQHRGFDGRRWSEWNDHGGVAVSPAALASPVSGHVDIVVRGGDGRLKHCSTLPFEIDG